MTDVTRRSPAATSATIDPIRGETPLPPRKDPMTMPERRCPDCGVSSSEFARHELADPGSPARDVVAAFARAESMPPPASQPRDAADRIAATVASWAFPLTVLSLIVVWLLVNAVRPVAPFPTVMLAVISAVLASLGALQGPIILRVQRRQRQRDRQRDEFDHRVNLRAELEVRWLEHKLDHLLAADRTTSGATPHDGDR